MKKVILSLFGLLLFMQFSFAQAVTVSGVVTSEDDGLPLPGVSVVIKGTTSGTSTDLDGAYTINVSQGQTLLFTSIGFVYVEQKIDRGQVNVVMKTDAV
ncbi:MAG: carboxypeptidase-like regulatory domain-containing protein, partial [Bacteroidales bacterium]|nr:carboxypeptidase-like regulatory domain-containing protein [Bacteroidales bacterium]